MEGGGLVSKNKGDRLVSHLSEGSPLPPDSVFCSACADIAIEPLRPSACTKCIFCRTCVPTLKDLLQCVHGIPMALVPADDVAQRAHVIPLECPWCSKALQALHFSDHLALCPEAVLLCSHPGCTEYIKRHQMEAHELLCLYKRTLCRHDCGASILRKDIDAHSNICLLAPVDCSCVRFCQSPITRGLVEEHLKSCLALPLACPKGCGEEVPRQLLTAHLRDCTSAHFTRFSEREMLEIFNLCEESDDVVRDWLRSIEVDPNVFSLTRVDKGRVWMALSDNARRGTNEASVMMAVQQAFSMRNFPFARPPIFDSNVPHPTFCPPLQLVDCPLHVNWFGGSCPFRHKTSANQVCRYWKIGRACLLGPECADKHPAVRLLSLNFERMSLGRCKWCGHPEPMHPAWECEKAPYNDAHASNNPLDDDETDETAFSGSGPTQAQANTLAQMVVEILQSEATHSKHITSLGSFLYQRYPAAKSMLIQSGLKLKAFIRRYPNLFRYDAETCLVMLVPSENADKATASGVNVAAPVSSQMIPCRWYASGNCKKGNRCPYFHDTAMRPRKVCEFFRRNGRCAWGNDCKWSHDLTDTNSDYSEPTFPSAGPSHAFSRNVSPVVRVAPPPVSHGQFRNAPWPGVSQLPPRLGDVDSTWTSSTAMLPVVQRDPWQEAQQSQSQMSLDQRDTRLLMPHYHSNSNPQHRGNWPQHMLNNPGASLSSDSGNSSPWSSTPSSGSLNSSPESNRRSSNSSNSRYTPGPISTSSASLWSPLVGPALSMSSSSTVSTLLPGHLRPDHSQSSHSDHGTSSGSSSSGGPSPMSLASASRSWRSQPNNISPHPPTLAQTGPTRSDTQLLAPKSNLEMDGPFFAPSPSTAPSSHLHRPPPGLTPIHTKSPFFPPQSTLAAPRINSNTNASANLSGAFRPAPLSTAGGFDDNSHLFFIPDTPKDPPASAPDFGMY